MAVSAFRSTTRREFQENQGQGHRRGSSHSESGSVLDSTSNYQDASSQRDSDQESYEPGPYNRHLASDSESEASSIIDRFRQTEISRNAATIPRFQQSTASARGRQRSIEPSRRSDSRGPEVRRRSESQEPGLRRQSSDFSRPRRSESQEPGLRRQSVEPLGGRQSSSELLLNSSDSGVYTRGRETSLSRQGRSQSKEPSIRRESQEPRQGRSSSKEPGARSGRNEERDRSTSKEPGARNGRNELRELAGNRDEEDESERRGRSSQRAGIVFTSRSTSQEPRRSSSSKEPIGRYRRSESQGPGHRGGTAGEHPGTDIQTEERTIRAVHAQLKPMDPPAGDVDEADLYGIMREEVRKAVADLKAEIEQSLEKDMLTLVASKGDVAESDVRQKYAEKLEQSEIRTQELLSQLAKEEETRHELAKLVKGRPSHDKPAEQPKRKTRRGVEERATISKALDEEAQKYFEEFASISTSETEESLDGRPSKSGKRLVAQSSRNATSHRKSPSRKQVPSRSEEFPRWKTGAVAVNTDGVVTPWLDWETDSADATATAISDFNWDSLGPSSSLADFDSVRVSEEPALQRIRFEGRIGAGRIHLCRTEF
ncbi:serine/arginine repetitive matrix protein 5-like isoform X2 [Selaginella moellendorffii]|uniref:serine/arginine repetitive matrix protein 5-like isoform X2 n=1 Tax=Selaginella moellendorffii TaxID=88036 RepID=UPI000D1CA2D3|nr:serine/arginine repetitive matrix protein 5-like isoform X2 [Selaginella moellendorffii]|eukprot:XP_024519994.1 serine/arginine repetitive matrix protein 5-like isoform X2 [Selaginella moellendorffii]